MLKVTDTQRFDSFLYDETKVRDNKMHYLTYPTNPLIFHGKAVGLWVAMTMVRLQKK